MEKNKKNVALVLSSGGPRGFAYIGAIEALEEHGYTITSIAGTSIGSLVGGIYAAIRGAKWCSTMVRSSGLSVLPSPFLRCSVP